MESGDEQSGAEAGADYSIRESYRSAQKVADYDADHARTLAQRFRIATELRLIRRELARRVRPGASILEVPAGTGRVAAVEGLAAAQQKMGSLVVDKQLPRIGAPRAQGYEGEGWVILKHEDDDVVRKAVMDLITTVRVRYA